MSFTITPDLYSPCGYNFIFHPSRLGELQRKWLHCFFFNNVSSSFMWLIKQLPHCMESLLQIPRLPLLLSGMLQTPHGFHNNQCHLILQIPHPHILFAANLKFSNWHWAHPWTSGAYNANLMFWSLQSTILTDFQHYHCNQTESQYRVLTFCVGGHQYQIWMSICCCWRTVFMDSSNETLFISDSSMSSPNNFLKCETMP